MVGYTQNRTPFLARISEEKMNSPFFLDKKGEVAVQGDKSLLYLVGLNLDTSNVRIAYRNEPVNIEYEGRITPLSHRILEDGMAYYLTSKGKPGRIEINGTTPQEIIKELYTFSAENPITIDLLFYGLEDWERTTTSRNDDNYAVQETSRRDRLHEVQRQPHL